MKTLLTSAALLLLSTSALIAQAARSTAPAARSATAALAAPPTSHPTFPHGGAPHNGVTHSALPMGWGLAQGPVSTVTHPGGVGRRPSTGQRGRYAQAIIVPLYYPMAVYPQQQSQAIEASDEQADGNNGDTQQRQRAYSYPSYNEPPAGQTSSPAADVAYTLIAFKDHSIYAVVDYWLQNNRLNYVTNYGSTSSVALDKIDMDLTEQLNGDRNMKFELREKQPGN